MFDNLSNKGAETETQAQPNDTQNQQPSAAETGVDLNKSETSTPGAEETQSQTQNNQPAGSAPDAKAETQQQIDYNKIIDEMSGGVIKSVDGFKAALPRFTEYDKLLKERDELSAKMAVAPVFVDDEVRILNELKAAGASKEQIKSFQKINEYGNLSEIPDREARIARMVIIDGVKPNVAEAIVDREFKIGDENVEGIDREILDENLRVESKKDREAMEKFKAKVSDVTQLPPEEAKLQQQAQLQKHQAIVKPYVGEVMASIPHLGTFNLSGKEGAEAVNYEMPIDEKGKAQIGQYLENYLMDDISPITEQKTFEALSYARAEYFREHQEEILQSVWDKAVSQTTEALVNKYENRSGLKPQQDNPIVGDKNSEAAIAGFMKKVADRTT